MPVLILTAREAEARAALDAAGLARAGGVESNLPGALERIEAEPWSLIVIDAQLAAGAALDLVEPLALGGRRVVVAAAQPTLAMTLRVLRSGASDVIPFPPPADRLRDLLAESAGAAPPAVEATEADGWIGSSPQLLEAFTSAMRLAPTEAPVLICGEPGTGKALLARVVHEASTRADGPWLTVNCGALPEPVLESELFGHERGGGPGVFGKRIGRLVKAAGGTLFLDEIERLTPRVQHRLAAALETGRIEPWGAAGEVPIDVRVVASAERDPRQLAHEGALVDTLYAALSPGLVVLPSLKERGEADIRALVQHFVVEFSARYKRDVREIGDDAWSVLLRHTWPGNVRQLRGAIERAVIHGSGPVLHARDLPREITDAAQRFPSEQSLLLEDVERAHILRVLELSGNHLGRTAAMLGIHRNTLSRKLRSYGVDVD